MLAVFNSSVANGPQELCSPSTRPDDRKPGLEILDSFASQTPEALHVLLPHAGGLSYTHHKQGLLTPRFVFSVFL